MRTAKEEKVDNWPAEYRRAIENYKDRIGQFRKWREEVKRFPLFYSLKIKTLGYGQHVTDTAIYYYFDNKKVGTLNWCADWLYRRKS